MRKGRSLICVPVIGKSFPEALHQILAAKEDADLFELRMDCLRGADRQEVLKLISHMGKPFILCLRRQEEGGFFEGSEEERLRKWIALSVLKPSYIDIEFSVSDHFLDQIRKYYSGSALILSYHDFNETPQDLPELLSRMQSRKADLYKIAAMANSSLDGMRMLELLKNNLTGGLVALCMGPEGEFTRILGAKAGSEIVYASPSRDEASAPGQIPLQEMVGRYLVPKMSAATEVLGLIGDPVTKSPSDVTHNRVIDKLGLNAVYVKIPVKREELPLFLKAAASFGLRGLSATMPLKEALAELVDSLQGDAKACGAINTLHFNDGKIVGYNTDGKGALDALEEWITVREKHLLVVGAGGAAKAIVLEAKRRGASVSIVNRTESKAMDVAKLAGADGYSFDSWKRESRPYDALIHCTPLGMFGDESIILEELIQNGKCLMDIVVSKEETALMKKARSKGCLVIGGYAMLIKQAISQFRIWRGGSIKKPDLEDAFEVAFRTLL